MERYSDDIDARLTARHKKCLEICGEVVGKKILDIGCYNGWFEKAAIEKGCKEVIGIDINDKFLDISRKNVGEARFLKISSIFSLPFPDNYFDIVTFFEVLEHISKNREKEALSEIKRILRNGGKLILSTPKANLFSKLMDPAWYFGHRHYSLSDVASLLKNSGFEVESVGSAGGFYSSGSAIVFYFFKWILNREIPFKNWLDKKRDEENLLKNNGLSTLFVKATKCN